MSDDEKLCRGCLSDEQQSRLKFKSIFTKKGDLLEQIYSLTNIKVSMRGF